jgi:hybrid cluster-associated redox disulfide protein
VSKCYDIVSGNPYHPVCPRYFKAFRRFITMAQITKDTRIGELLQLDTDVSPILLSIGMHCLGCPASQMETIEEAAAVHGVNVDELVKALNDKVNG